MERLIFSLFISLFLLWVGLPANAQDKKKEKPAIEYPLLNGISVSADLYGVGNYMLGSDFLSSEIAVDVSLKNRFFPILEVGYGSTDAFVERGITYKSSAPYFRIGMNYNTMYKKKDDYYLYVGLRYGISSMNFDVHAHVIEDGIWGGPTIGVPSLTDNEFGGLVPFDRTGMKATMHWAEFLLGVRVKVYKNIQMGWTIRMKSKLSLSNDEYGDPWYVPGYGRYGSSRLGMTYSIIYKLPF